MPSSFRESMISRAKTLTGLSILLPESTDERMLQASNILIKEEICTHIIMLGDKDIIRTKAHEYNLSLPDEITIVNPETDEHLEEFIHLYYEKRKHKGVTQEQAQATMKQPMFFATMMIAQKLASALVAGALHSTANVLRPAIQIVGTSKESNLVSSFFVMESPITEIGHNGQCIFSDCAIIPRPSVENLVDITVASATSCRDTLNVEPIISLLSFSSLGSADHEEVQKVRDAVAKLKTQYPELTIDGELQMDAAINSSVAKIKAPNSPTAGKSNTLIFPDLSAGNIAYKTAQQFGNMNAYGPFIQGLAAPINDLSRGCSTDEIVLSCATSLCQAHNLQEV